MAAQDKGSRSLIHILVQLCSVCSVSWGSLKEFQMSEDMILIKVRAFQIEKKNRISDLPV